MKRRIPPPGARPWEAPDYRFDIGWPPLYKPVLADEMLAGRSSVQDSANASKSRQQQIETGTGWGTGTVPGLSRRAEEVQAGMAKNGRIKKASALG